MEIARESSRLTEANLDEQRREIDRKQAAMAGYILRMLADGADRCLAVACVAILRNTGLERQSKQQCARAEDAERELRVSDRRCSSPFPTASRIFIALRAITSIVCSRPAG